MLKAGSEEVISSASKMSSYIENACSLVDIYESPQVFKGALVGPWNFKLKLVCLPVPGRGSITSYESLKKNEIVPKKILSSVEWWLCNIGYYILSISLREMQFFVYFWAIMVRMVQGCTLEYNSIDLIIRENSS